MEIKLVFGTGKVINHFKKKNVLELYQKHCWSQKLVGPKNLFLGKGKIINAFNFFPKGKRIVQVSPLNKIFEKTLIKVKENFLVNVFSFSKLSIHSLNK